VVGEGHVMNVYRSVGISWGIRASARSEEAHHDGIQRLVFASFHEYLAFVHPQIWFAVIALIFGVRKSKALCFVADIYRGVLWGNILGARGMWVMFFFSYV